VTGIVNDKLITSCASYFLPQSMTPYVRMKDTELVLRLSRGHNKHMFKPRRSM